MGAEGHDFGIEDGVTNMSAGEIITKRNTSTESFYEYFALTTGVLTTVCIGLLIVNVLTFVSMRRCRRIPYACKLLTCIMCICDSIFVSIVLSGFILIDIKVGAIITSIFTEVGRLCFVVSWLTITLMSVERVFCLYCPNFYAKHSSKRNIKIVICVTLCTCILIKIFTRYVVNPIVHGKPMDFVENTKDLNINTFILGILLITNVLCYTVIFKVVKRQVNRMNTIAPIQWSQATVQYASTKAVCIIFTVFLIFHAPLFISFIVHNGTTNAVKSRYLNFIFMLIMCGIYPILYAWRFKECRYHTTSLVSECFRIKSQRIERMRMNVYNIEPSPNRLFENREPC